jgi:hypothetical protein
MGDVNLDSFEESIQSGIKKIRPKSKQRGYVKGLVAKLYPTIEQSLANGCSYEEIAIAIARKNVKISSVTLKQYHLSNKRIKKSESGSQDLENTENATTHDSKYDINPNRVESSGEKSFKKLPTSSQPDKPSDSEVQHNQSSIHSILSI